MPLLQGTHRYQTGISSLDACIAPDDPVRLMDALVEKLDLDKLHISLPQSEEGRPAFHPKVLLKLYLYGYTNHIRSSRRLKQNAGATWKCADCWKNSCRVIKPYQISAKTIRCSSKIFSAWILFPKGFSNPLGGCVHGAISKKLLKTLALG